MRLAHGGAGPGPGLADAVALWPAEPLVWLAVFLLAFSYLRSARRVRRWPLTRPAAFGSGLGALLAALASPLAPLAHASFAWHMVQHLLLTLVAAPALLLGAPVTLALRAARPGARRRLVRLLHAPPARAATHPVVAWGALAAVMWASHFTPLYDAALRDGGLHALEHALYLGAALLFWAPVVGLDPAGVRLSHPVRLAYLILALPVGSFLGLALWSSSRLLYPHYAGSGLADQRAGAVVMWVGGDLLFVAALVAVAVAWMRHDEREAARLDRRLAEG